MKKITEPLEIRLKKSVLILWVVVVFLGFEAVYLKRTRNYTFRW